MQSIPPVLVPIDSLVAHEHSIYWEVVSERNAVRKAAYGLLDALETIANGNTDPDRMVQIANDAIRAFKGL